MFGFFLRCLEGSDGVWGPGDGGGGLGTCGQQLGEGGQDDVLVFFALV